MKAIVQHKYGGVNTLQLLDIQKPTIKANEVLIEVYAANVASGDMRINTIDVPWILKPILRLVFGISGPRKKVRGVTGSGVIEKIGSNVTKYKVGDRVNYINSMGAGCMAEFLVLKESSVMSTFSDEVTFEDAAPIAFGAMSAYHFINEEAISKGNQVLVYGASGSVGSYAVQLAKHYGATVTAVSSKKNHEVMKAIGSDFVIDYKSEDFTQGTIKYDVIFDAVSKTTKKQCKNVLKENGVYMSVRSMTKEKSSRVELLNDMLHKKQIKTVLDKVFELDEYKKAHELVYGKHKVGNVVIKIK